MAAAATAAISGLGDTHETAETLCFTQSLCRAGFDVNRRRGRYVLSRRRYLTVSATAEVRVKPDRVSVMFGIHHRDKNLRAAKDHMNRVVKDAIAFCKARGIAEKNIQTASVHIAPVYRERYSETEKRRLDELDYYQLEQNIHVVMEDPEKYEEILYGLLDQGINTVEDVRFSTTELRKHRDNARLAAIRAAREKAELLTQAAGITLGKAVGIRENDETIYGSRRMSMNVSQNMAQIDAGSGGARETIASGMIGVAAGVTIEYALETPP